MDSKVEIDKVSAMLKSAGFKLLDVQFEGVIDVMDPELGSRLITLISKMAVERQQAFGVFRMYYECDGDTRMIEVPVGAAPGGEMPPEDLPPEELPPQAPPQRPARR
jgi:hypothetical protein